MKTLSLSTESLLIGYDDVSILYPHIPPLSHWDAWEHAAYQNYNSMATSLILVKATGAGCLEDPKRDELLKQLTKSQCHDRNAPVLNPVGSARNVKNKGKKTLKGELPIEIARDRQGAFEPQLIL